MLNPDGTVTLPAGPVENLTSTYYGAPIGFPLVAFVVAATLRCRRWRCTGAARRGCGPVPSSR